jgi:hypothetical protein
LLLVEEMSERSGSGGVESREGLQRALAQARANINAESVAKLQEKTLKVCIARCLPSPPGDKLTERHRKCLEDCAGSFSETYRVAGETIASIYQREQS